MKKKNKKDINKELHYKSHLYMLEIIQIKLISQRHNDSVEYYFGVAKTYKLIALK